MSTLIPKSSGSLEKDSAGNLVSDGLIFAGVGTLPVWFIASHLPGGMFFWAVLFVVAGMTTGWLSNRS